MHKYGMIFKMYQVKKKATLTFPQLYIHIIHTDRKFLEVQIKILNNGCLWEYMEYGMGARLTFHAYTLELFSFCPHKFITCTVGEMTDIYLLLCDIYFLFSF